MNKQKPSRSLMNSRAKPGIRRVGAVSSQSLPVAPSQLRLGRHVDFLTSNVSVHAAHVREAVTVSLGICHNNHHLQNNSVILMDKSGENKQP